MTADDGPEVARLHEQAFPDFFLSSLGTAALLELYRGMIQDESGITLVASADGRIVGLAAGSTAPAGFYRRLFVRRFWRFLTVLAPRVAKTPQLLWRLAWRVTESASESHLGEASLLSLAVQPSGQRRGIGAELVRQFLGAARDRGANRVTLTTDAMDNERVTMFYERMGFRRRATFFTREKRELHEYVCDL